MVSTADDLLAFGRMLLNGGAHGGARILSRLAVELMTVDQLSAEQKAASPFFQNFWDTRGWGLGVSMVTRRGDLADVPGRFGWDGAFSTSLYVDPREQMLGILLAQCRPGGAATAAGRTRLLDLGLSGDRRLNTGPRSDRAEPSDSVSTPGPRRAASAGNEAAA